MDCDTPITGMAEPLLREIAQHLQALAMTGATAAVDLRSLPMSDADRVSLEARLGRGEVDIRVNAVGTSEIWETAYPGVWWVRHRGGDDLIAAERIEIAPLPEILAAHPADIDQAAARLAQDLSPAGKDAADA